MRKSRFQGQRKDSFAVNLGEIFDLVNLNPVGSSSGEQDALADKNGHYFSVGSTDCLSDWRE